MLNLNLSLNLNLDCVLALALGLGVVVGCNPGYTLAGESGGPATQTGSVYDFTLNDVDGKALPLNQFRGKVLLLVNTASLCGNTPQYEQLQTMYERYQGRGFEIPTDEGPWPCGATKGMKPLWTAGPLTRAGNPSRLWSIHQSGREKIPGAG